MDKFQRSFLGAAIVALLANLFFFRSIEFTGLVISLLIFIAYVCVSYGQKWLTPFSLLLVSWSVILGILVIFRSISVIQFLLFMTMGSVSMLLVFLFATDLPVLRAVRDIIVLPLVIAGSYLVSFGEQLFTSNGLLSHVLGKRMGKSGITQQAVLSVVGIVVGIPIVGFLLMLLANADPIFGKAVGEFFAHISLTTAFWRIVGTIAIFVFLIPWAFLKIKADLWNIPISKKTSVIVQPMTIILLMVAITMALFLVIQWPYVFVNVAAETDLTKYGIATYSEYVKKGFSEFLVVALFLYGLLWGGYIAIRTKETKIDLLSILFTIVTTLFFIYIASIGRRILLYWDLHGLSLIRVYGGLFLVWVSFLTALVWLRQFIRARFVMAEVIGSLAFVTFLGVWNAESFIVSHHPPTVNKNVDYVYLSRMSSDGYEGWIASYAHAKEVVGRTDYQKKPLLTAEDRREIAGAGVALGMITRNYDTLMMRYGSEAELQIYQDAVFAAESQSIADTKNLFEQSAEMLKRKSDATVSLDAYVYLGGGKLSEISSRLDDLKRIVSDTARLTSISGEKKLGTKEYRFIPRAPYTLRTYASNLCAFQGYQGDIAASAWCVPSVYVLEIRENSKKPTILDKIFTWNNGQYTAFKKLKTDISLFDLLTTQSQYQVLWKKILSQPPNERTVDMDLSFEAPFISSLW